MREISITLWLPVALPIFGEFKVRSGEWLIRSVAFLGY